MLFLLGLLLLRVESAGGHGVEEVVGTRDWVVFVVVDGVEVGRWRVLRR